MFNFVDKNSSESHGKRIELQVRTTLQHAWATAIESVGLFRREELKNHKGSTDWLRLFELMSGELAEAEGCPTHSEWPSKGSRRKEIKELANHLNAVSILESIVQGVKGTDIPLSPGFRPTHYLLRFDHATKTVTVEPHNIIKTATQSYDKAEAQDNQTGHDRQNVVLVEVDKIANLKKAYPNYFGDVRCFAKQLKRVTQGRSAVEYTAAPKQRAPAQPDEIGDPSWMRRSSTSRPRF